MKIENILPSDIERRSMEIIDSGIGDMSAFSEPEKLLDTDDIAVGPKKTAEVGTYTSLCWWRD